MARTDTLNNYLTDIATAIKEKKGDTAPINASKFDEEIKNLPSGGAEDLTVELTEQDNLIATQEVTIEDIEKALNEKVAGGKIIFEVEDKTLVMFVGKTEGGVLTV